MHSSGTEGTNMTVRIILLALASLVPAALAFDPKDKAIKQATEAAEVAERSEAWLRSSECEGALIFVEKMNHDFDKVLLGEVHRRKKVSLCITTKPEKADFTLSGDVHRRRDLPEEERGRAGWNGAKHRAALSLVSSESGTIVWACHEDDRDKFDFNSTGHTFRRVAERCVNHLINKISKGFRGR